MQESSPEWRVSATRAGDGDTLVSRMRRGTRPKSQAELNLWALQNMPVHDYIYQANHGVKSPCTLIRRSSLKVAY